MSALTLFVSSCFATVLLQNIKNRLVVSTLSVIDYGCTELSEAQYVATLKELFNPYRHGTSKLPSRHVGGNSSDTESIFAQRKSVFQTLYRNSGLHRRAGLKVIHVAGTKGKGSTVEYLASGIIESGRSVGVFTSPHMHTACERVRINRSLISRELLVEYGRVALDLLNPYSWTVFFDLLMAVALMHFGKNDIDYMLLETGIGGRYDTTNFCDDTSVCVITSISLDHQNILGDTVEEIAWQKAGIIKRNARVFTTSSQRPSVLEVFRKQCAEVGAELCVVEPDRYSTNTSYANLLVRIFQTLSFVAYVILNCAYAT